MKLKFKLLVLFIPIISTTLGQKGPYATIKVENKKYVDQTEVDVASWLSYYSWVLEQEGEEAAERILPDSCCVLPEIWFYIKNCKSDKKSNYLAKNSFISIGYYKSTCADILTDDLRKLEQSDYTKNCILLDYPITGVSYDQVVQFCRWRTKVQGDEKYLFRLMTEDEWKKYALSGLTESEQKSNQKDTMYFKFPSYGYKTQTKAAGKYKNFQLGQLLIPASYLRDNNHIYDLFGNVAEMISQKGIAKGGSYADYASHSCNVDSVQYYSKPEKWLGFRCIAEKVKRDKKKKNR